MATIGIDLGTSNSLVGYWNGESAVLIENEFGEVLTPSIISVDDNQEILVGQIAKERLMTHPQLTAATFKRFMGTEKIYKMGTYSFTPVELSTLLLKKLKQNAERMLNEEYCHAIISVPAYFNNVQRAATIEAANLAGLEVNHLISEPTAAAMAYGIHRLEEDSRILVIDLGGGTFDVSLLEMFEGIMQVEAIAGDNRLGGEDFTYAILKDCLAENKLDQQVLPAEIEASLYKKIEMIKKELSPTTPQQFEFVLDEKEYTYQLTEERFRSICQPLLAKLRAPIIRVLNDSGIKLDEIDRIILIGGATKSTTIRSFVSKLLGKLPFTQINPDEAVGVGATIQSALKENKEMLEEMILTDVCGHTLGVNTSRFMENDYRDGYFSPIIERNTTVPVSKIQTFCTIYDGQQAIVFDIYQGENRLVKDNLKIGSVEIKMPKVPKGEPVDVRFTYDHDGILEVIVMVPRTKKTNRIVIENTPGQLSQIEIENRLKKLESLKIHPLDRAETRLLLARAERLYAESIGEKREYIQYLIGNFEAVLRKQDEKETRKASSELNKLLNKLEENFQL